MLGYITSQWDRCLVPQNVFLVFVIFLPYFLLLLTRTKVLLSFSLVCVYTFLRNFVRQILSLSLSVAKPVLFCRKSTASSFLPQSLPVSATFFSTTFFAANLLQNALFCCAVCSFLLQQVYRKSLLFLPQIYRKYALFCRTVCPFCTTLFRIFLLFTANLRQIYPFLLRNMLLIVAASLPQVSFFTAKIYCKAITFYRKYANMYINCWQKGTDFGAEFGFFRVWFDSHL